MLYKGISTVDIFNLYYFTHNRKVYAKIKRTIIDNLS